MHFWAYLEYKRAEKWHNPNNVTSENSSISFEFLVSSLLSKIVNVGYYSLLAAASAAKIANNSRSK